MSAVERAAEVISAEFAYAYAGEDLAQALADAHLLVTDEMLAVLEAAIEWVRADMNDSSYVERCGAHYHLRRTVRELHASRPS